MSALEAKIIGVLPEENEKELQELLMGISGLPAEDLLLHELVMRPPMADRADLTLQHSMATLAPATAAGHSGRCKGSASSGSWLACQYGLPLRGRYNLALPATVRSVTRAACGGRDVPSFWKALGFVPRYEVLKRGQRYEVHHSGHCIEVFLGHLLRMPPGAAGDFRLAQELVPGQMLVEATTEVGEGAQVEASAVLASFAKLLDPLTVLAPLPVPRGGWLKQQLMPIAVAQQAAAARPKRVV